MGWFAKNFRKREKILYIERDTGVKESILVGEMKRMVAGMKKRYKMILVLHEIYLFRRFFTFGKKYATDLGYKANQWKTVLSAWYFDA
ncbi:MAG: hypothetical protein OMM_10148 [Candidatus Magnetoglobus multicellularis str. Araruama]|uniref:Uncharacterized protein n=1 Tax=Candidatus Magnetoglobus multicellularis str. Araruama TaxID=890399 RepID=A0A1V1P1Q8_9BACT|nr:MAG: hypothetical protein OMM_10148 [Candidatus Magnetoglobus multicellularis str. Araruama]